MVEPISYRERPWVAARRRKPKDRFKLRSWAPWANERRADRILLRRDPDQAVTMPLMRLKRARWPVHEKCKMMKLVPCWCAVDALMAGLPEQPFAFGEASFDDLVTIESHLLSTLTLETIVRFEPTPKLIRAVAAVLARHASSVVHKEPHGD